MLNGVLIHTRSAWGDFPIELSQLVAQLPKGATIVEIGGGANPALLQEMVAGLCYMVVDIDQTEIDKARGTYFQSVCTDISLDAKGIKCDLIFSKMLMEHIPNPERFYLACNQMLNTGGIALHFFATKYTIASVINMVLPEHVSKRVLYRIQKRDWEKEGKFPAYYRWTKGPTRRQIERLEKVGFEVVKYQGYFGSKYLINVPVLKYVEHFFNFLSIRFQSPWFCSSAIVVLKKN